MRKESLDKAEMWLDTEPNDDNESLRFTRLAVRQIIEALKDGLS